MESQTNPYNRDGNLRDSLGTGHISKMYLGNMDASIPTAYGCDLHVGGFLGTSPNQRNPLLTETVRQATPQRQ